MQTHTLRGHWHWYSLSWICDSQSGDESAFFSWWLSKCPCCRGVNLMPLSLLSPLHRCFLFHLYFNLSPTPSPLAVVVCGLQGGCVSAGPLPVWAVRSGLRWVLPGQGPLLHLGRTCLQPLYADRAQVGRTYQLYADPDSTDNITADWVSPYGLNLFYYEKNQCGINLPKFDLNHICW